MLEKTPFDMAAFCLDEAARYFHQCRALHEVGKEYTTHNACAMIALELALKQLGFRLIPITEQKDAA